MTLRWLLRSASALPEGDDWLGTEERKALAGLRFPKRRSEWRLGRFVAKQALSSFAEIDALDRLQVIAAADGAPEAFVDGRSMECAISISHRENVAACVIAERGTVGCDLEAVEPRTSRFVNDFFSDRERAEVENATGAQRETLIALTWSAKESTLKALRVGLRRDTRCVEVQIDDLDTNETGWHELRAMVSPEARVFRGWWRREGGVVLTVMGEGLEVIDRERLGARRELVTE